jgi:predicted transcriptional regulator
MGGMASNYLQSLFGEPSSPPEVAAPQEGKPTEVMDLRGRAKEYLGKGMKPIQVAQVLGCSPSLIAQYMSEQDFAEQVRQLQLQSSYSQALRDERLNKLEDMAIDAVEASMQNYKGLTKPEVALTILKTLNGLQRRAPVLSAGVVDADKSAGTVSISLPEFMQNAVVNIQVNTSNEVVEVNGRKMLTMNSANVMKELEVFQEKQQQKLLEVNKGGARVPEEVVVEKVPAPKQELLPSQKAYPEKVINALNLSATMINAARRGSRMAQLHIQRPVGEEVPAPKPQVPALKAGMFGPAKK